MCNTQTLWLSNNMIGDPGITALAEAVSNGAVPQGVCKGSDADVADGIPLQLQTSEGRQSPLPDLELLSLEENQISDAGITAFADAVSKGALPNLKELYLQDNRIGDTGISSFADAVSKGALPNLKELYLFQDAPALEAACKARGFRFQ